jgi:hypothetical protein
VGETEGEAGRGADDERQERVGAGGGLRVSHGSLWGLGWGSFARRTEWRVVWSRVPSTFPRGKKSLLFLPNSHQGPLLLPQLQNHTNHLPQLFKPCILPPRAVLKAVCYSTL